MQAAPIAGKIKHTNVYHQNINYNIIFVILYLQQVLQPIRSITLIITLYLLYCTYNKYCNQ